MDFRMILIAGLMALINTAAARSLDMSSNNSDMAEWMQYKLDHAKNYTDNEDVMRKKIFDATKLFLKEFNETRAKTASYVLTLNKFADMSDDEIVRMKGYKAPAKKNCSSLGGCQDDSGNTFLQSIFNDNSKQVPDELDWRNFPGRVSEVKNQGSKCGSCYAFAAVAVLEGQEFERKGSLIKLSEQNLIDCIPAGWNDSPNPPGCDGGWSQQVYDYVKNGITDEQSYPYEGKKGLCRVSEHQLVFSDAGYADLPQGDEEKLKEVVAKYGPVSIAFDSRDEVFKGYGGKILDNLVCSKENPDHAVTIVGYGTDPIEHKDYWILKNSWGKNWGEDGYFRLVRGKNECGVANYASIATF